MYKQFYGLRDIPFSLAPDPKYLFRTDSLLEVFANLQYGIENGKGLVVVTGEVGTGKTTILRSMLQSLDRSVLAAYIFNPILTTEDFFELLNGFGESSPRITEVNIGDVVEELDLGSFEIACANKTMAEATVRSTSVEPVAAGIAPGDNGWHTQTPPSNVQYIRRNAEAPGRASAASAGNGKFVISSDRQTDSEAPLTFFSRVRVSRSS